MFLKSALFPILLLGIGFPCSAQEKPAAKPVELQVLKATMRGENHAKLKTVSWMTKVKDPSGKPIVQETLVTQNNDKERLLILMMPGAGKDEFVKFMQIEFVKRK